MVTDIIAPKRSIIYRDLMRLESFPECWRSTYITAIPKGAPAPDRENNNNNNDLLEKDGGAKNCIYKD